MANPGIGTERKQSQVAQGLDDISNLIGRANSVIDDISSSINSVLVSPIADGSKVGDAPTMPSETPLAGGVRSLVDELERTVSRLVDLRDRISL